MKVVKASCWICGKKFKVKIVSTGKIMSKCFHSLIHPELWSFRWWTYQILDTKRGILDEKNTKICFKNNFYKIMGFCGTTREVLYFIWKLIHKRKSTRYWECSNCC